MNTGERPGSAARATRRACIRCDRPVADALDASPETGEVPADGAAVFTATGNYGSVFDPDDGTILEVVVCDPCLTTAGVPVLGYTESIVATRTPTSPPAG